jgi:alpha-L-rhamnosidase
VTELFPWRRLVLMAAVVLLALPLTSVSVRAEAQEVLAVGGLTAEREASPLGVDAAAPRLGWQLESAARGTLQSAYQVQVSSSAAALADGDADVWDSGRVESRDSVLVPYGGPALEPATRYHWRVRVWGQDGTESDWSEPAWWETGLFSPADWQAEWITAPQPDAWTDVTIEAELTVLNDAMGVFFRATGAGDSYMWQLANFGGAPVLRPHVRIGGNWTLLDEIPIDHVIPPEEFGGPHVMTVELSGETFTTWIDGEQVDTRDHDAHASGSIGLRTNGSESGVLHRISVTDEEGTLFEADLSTDANPFTAGEIVDGGLAVSGNVEAMFAGEPLPLLRREFTIDKAVRSARIHASALGVYELSLNGDQVGDHRLAPGWTDYDTRIQHQTFDVTDQLRAGENVLGGLVAPGWYSGHIAWFGTGFYGDQPALLAQLTIEYADGTSDVLGTDETWRTATGPLVTSDMIMGERYDARDDRHGWDVPGYDDSEWSPVEIADTDATDRLVPQIDPPVRVTEELAAQEITEPEPGTWVIDLGQNMVGTVRLKVEGPAGQTVRLRHAEVLNPDGTVYTANLRSAAATDYYTLNGRGVETYEPYFTFHGFRYVELTGFPGEPDLDTVTGLVLHTDSPLVSRFETSDPMLNQLHSNITWGQRGNFLSIPTDTPARDERLGWTGDINVFAGTAAFNMDALTFLSKWLIDLRDAQHENGSLPDVAPDACCGDGVAGWADAGVTVPWTLWQRYGDTRVIEDNYDMMTAWVDYMEETSSNLIRPDFGYGDWLNLNDDTNRSLIGTAYFAYSSSLLADMAEAVGRDDDAGHYRELSVRVAEAFNDRYVSADGRIDGDTQTGYVLALGMDLLPDDLRPAAAQQLVDKVEERDGHLSTGFLGTPDLLPVLAGSGHLDVAYQLLLNRTYPSWGYQIDLGATTMWERWDSIRSDGSFQDAGMNSFNHYAYGAVGDWMYRTIGGIEAGEPGYRHTVIRPRPGGDLDHARVEYDSAYGTISSGWRYDDGRLVQEVTIPANVTADVHVPAQRSADVTEGGVPAADVDGVSFVEMTDEAAVYRIGSGTYIFSTDPVMGDIIAAADAVDALVDHIRKLADAGELDRGERNYLNTRAGMLADEIEQLSAVYTSGDSVGAAKAAHRGLTAAAGMARWVEIQVSAQRMDAEVGESITGRVTPVQEALWEVSSALVGAVASIELPGAGVLPGDKVRVTAALENTGTGQMTGIDASVKAMDGWSVTPVGTGSNALGPGERADFVYDVEVPAGASIGAAEISGQVRYRVNGATVSLPIAAEVEVESPLVVTDVTAESALVGPGQTSTVNAVVHNRSSVEAAGSVSAQLPDGWSTRSAVAVDVEPSGEQTVEFVVTAGQEGTAGKIDGSLDLIYADGTLVESAAVPIQFDLVTPPDEAIGHVDLGNPESEQAHNLQASPTSGTNVEAGLTRRYTFQGEAGAYFEFDLAVEAGQAFALRAIETYNGPQRKDYEIYVNGVLVHERDHRRTEQEEGTVTFQIVVDGDVVGSDGVATIRFQEDALGANHDPSIADVWAIPLD